MPATGAGGPGGGRVASPSTHQTHPGMTLRELTQLVALGEGAHLEFKRKVPRPERIAKEVIAFANTRGGHLLLGVDDDGSVVGVRDAAEEEFSFRQALDAHCHPPVDFAFERIPVKHRRDVLRIYVPPSKQRPHYLVHNEHERVAYVRVDDMSVEASREVLQLMRSREAPDARAFEFGEKELMLMRYLEHYGRITVSQYATLAGVPRRRASATLVRLARADVLELHPDPRHDYFTLAAGAAP